MRNAINFSVQISDIVGFEVKPSENSTLLDMLMAGLSEFSDRLVQHGGKHINIYIFLIKLFLYVHFIYSPTVEPRLEEIGAAASKEYSLEKAMDKMKSEWTDLEFSFSQYRDSVRTGALVWLTPKLSSQMSL